MVTFQIEISTNLSRIDLLGFNLTLSSSTETHQVYYDTRRRCQSIHNHPPCSLFSIDILVSPATLSHLSYSPYLPTLAMKSISNRIMKSITEVIEFTTSGEMCDALMNERYRCTDKFVGCSGDRGTASGGSYACASDEMAWRRTSPTKGTPPEVRYSPKDFLYNCSSAPPRIITLNPKNLTDLWAA